MKSVLDALLIIVVEPIVILAIAIYLLVHGKSIIYDPTDKKEDD